MADETNQSQDAPPQARATIEFVVPDPDSGLFTTYANHVQLGFTLFDVRLLFGEIVGLEANKITVEQRAHVTLSWLQAKLLLVILHKALADHESRNGEIKLPMGIEESGIETTTAVHT